MREYKTTDEIVLEDPPVRYIHILFNALGFMMPNGEQLMSFTATVVDDHHIVVEYTTRLVSDAPPQPLSNALWPWETWK